MKYQALGNDYLIVDPLCGGVDLGAAPAPPAVRLLCNRRFGVGADGLILGPLKPPIPGVAVSLRIFNADGSECGMSGNGLRMFALYLAEHVPEWRRGDGFTVRLGGGDAQLQVVDFTHGRVRVGMGVPKFSPPVELQPHEVGSAARASLDTEDAEAWVAVSDLHLGVPHAVLLMDRIDEGLAQRLGQALAWHPRYPEGTNVEFVCVRDRRHLDVEVWERAAGYVSASGAGACAAAAVAYAHGLIGPDVEVSMPGGTVDVGVAQDGQVNLTGTAKEVMRGFLSPPLRSELMRLCRASEPVEEGGI